MGSLLPSDLKNSKPELVKKIEKLLNKNKMEFKRAELEKKLKTYIEKNYNIFFQVVVKHVHPMIKNKIDLKIIIISDIVFNNSSWVKKDILPYIKDVTKDMKVIIEFLDIPGYFLDSLNNCIFKKTFNLDSRYRIYKRKPHKATSRKTKIQAFTRIDNVVCLNLERLEYSRKDGLPTSYDLAKQFPLFYIDVLKFTDPSPIYDNAKLVPDKMQFANMNGVLYIGALDYYMNVELNVNKLHNSLAGVDPIMLGFFNYLFHKIEYDNHRRFINCKNWYDRSFTHHFGMKIGIIDNSKIKLYCKTNVCGQDIVVNFLLSFNEKENKIKVKIDCLNPVLKSSRYEFALPKDRCEYSQHVRNIDEKLVKMIASEEDMCAI